MDQNLLPELIAMQRISEIIASLLPDERKRVAAWLTEYVAQHTNTTQAPDSTGTAADAGGLFAPCAPEAPCDAQPEEELAAGSAPDAKAPTPTTFAELYEAIAPKRGAQKAAVAAYWLETHEGQQSWTAFEVNKLLKSLDVKVSSMSIVLTNAVKATSPLVCELERLGNSTRSRKTFRLSEQGFSYVEGQLA